MSTNTRNIVIALGVVIVAFVAYSMLGNRATGPAPATTTTTTTPVDTTKPATNTQ